MVKAIMEAPQGFKLPTSNKLRTTLIDKSLSRVDQKLVVHKQAWARYGCSIIMDGWTNSSHHPLLNIIVSSSGGTFFFKAIDCSEKYNNVIARFVGKVK
jgi:hypothetical protein